MPWYSNFFIGQGHKLLGSWNCSTSKLGDTLHSRRETLHPTSLKLASEFMWDCCTSPKWCIYIYTYIAMKISYTYLRPGKCFLACAHNVIRHVHFGAKEPWTLLKIWGISQYQDYPPYHFIILYTGSCPKIIKSRKRMKAYDLKRGRDLQPFLTTVTSCIQGPTHSWTFVRKRLQAMSLFGQSHNSTKHSGAAVYHHEIIQQHEADH